MRIGQLLLGVVCVLGVTSATALDEAKKLAGVDRAQADFGVSGAGVVIAIMDRGLDHTHPAFTNADGSTRIVGMLDLTDDSGKAAKGNLYGVGTRYTAEDIDTALANSTPLPTADDEGRGTASVGIACGKGPAASQAAWHGVAHNAEILFVKLGSTPSLWDPADPIQERFMDRRPQHFDTTKPLPLDQIKPQPGDPLAKEEPSAEAYFGLNRLGIAMDYCVAEAKARKLPLVILMNYGEIGGPTDGTSALCRKIDEITGPGVVFVTGTSDKGDRENRMRGTVRQGQVTEVLVEKESFGEVTVDIWYPGDSKFDVRVTTKAATYGPYAAPKYGKSEYEKELQYYHLHPKRSTHRPGSGKRQIRIDLIGAPGRVLIELRGSDVSAKPGAGTFDAFISPNPENPLDEPFNHFVDKKKPAAEDEYIDPEKVGLHGTIWDGATAKNAIAVGCFIHRNEWTNIQGRELLQVSEGKLGAIWRGSGRGPAANGPHGVTLCAPADRIVTTYARNAEWAETKNHILNDDAGAMYGLSSGTSAAASFVAGVAALMLERNPMLDGAAVKALLARTAAHDRHTGTVPNRTWGHGKINAYAAIAAAAPPAPEKPSKKRNKK